MKKNTICVALSMALLSMTAAQAEEFDGGWIGGKLGNNRSSLTGLEKKNAMTYGVEGGYNWNLSNTLLALYGYADYNDKATHNPGAVNYGSRTYGLGAKLGLSAGKWLPYVKLGYGRTNGTGAPLASAIGSTDAHLGLGVEYKIAQHWSLTGEFTKGSGKNAITKLDNENFTVGLNYYFGGPAPAPAPVVAAPVVKEEPKPAPVVEPAPAPKEAWKVIMEEKPVVIEGANFDTDSAKLKPSADAKLQQVVDFATKYPEANMEVSGHTDNRGKDAYNQKLSEKRAASVKAYLVKKGVASGRISAKGYGKTKPVADNKTKEGRAANRRAEIRYTIREEKKVRVQ